MHRLQVVLLFLAFAIGIASAGCGGSVAGPKAVAPSISTEPANQAVTVGQTATFTVAATGTAPLTYQWQKNGAAVSGATSASYTTPVTTSADNGAQFVVVVSNSTGSVTSSASTLTVSASAVPPSITTQPTSNGRADSHVHSGGYRHGAAELPVAEEQHGHQRSHFGELHHARDDLRG